MAAIRRVSPLVCTSRTAPLLPGRVPARRDTRRPAVGHRATPLPPPPPGAASFHPPTPTSIFFSSDAFGGEACSPPCLHPSPRRGGGGVWRVEVRRKKKKNSLSPSVRVTPPCQSRTKADSRPRAVPWVSSPNGPPPRPLPPPPHPPPTAGTGSPRLTAGVSLRGDGGDTCAVPRTPSSYYSAPPADGENRVRNTGGGNLAARTRLVRQGHRQPTTTGMAGEEEPRRGPGRGTFRVAAPPPPPPLPPPPLPPATTANLPTPPSL